MNVHIDLTFFVLVALAIAYFVGWVGFEGTVVLMLAAGLPSVPGEL